MREQERGDIVIVSSVATEYLNPGFAPYNMSKSAVEILAFTLAKEERRHGVRVNVVAPGLVETEMGRRMIAANRGIDDVRKLDPAMPYAHVCTPEEVADVVRFLVSDGGSYVNGQRIYVDGGAV